jgi:hypothetical protein
MHGKQASAAQLTGPGIAFGRCRAAGSASPAQAAREPVGQPGEYGSRHRAQDLDDGVLRPAVTRRLEKLGGLEPDREPDREGEDKPAPPRIGQGQHAGQEHEGEEALEIGADCRKMRAAPDRRQSGEGNGQHRTPADDGRDPAERGFQVVQASSLVSSVAAFAAGKDQALQARQL